MRLNAQKLVIGPHSHDGLIEKKNANRRHVTESQRAVIDGKLFSRAGRRLRVQGVTYGPFAPDGDGHQFPAPETVRDDFARMDDAGVNAIRTYHVPPNWLLEIADETGMLILVDVPWPKHLCFLDSERSKAQARAAVTDAAKALRDHQSVLAISICNEIPTDVARWHRPRRIERFLAELADSVKQVDPALLTTYANYPPTEYLCLPFLDFATFNVYLHDRDAFRRYMARLQNLVGDKPLVLGELGMDTIRHGEIEQAEFLAGHLREARLMGLAGAFVFSWTDEWFTGGHPITDWAFGLTHPDRTPKASYHALREVFTQSPAELLDVTPRVSVVVCTFNGGRTLDQCLRSLQQVDYPDYEVIVVDDGSTDNVRKIVSCYPDVRAIHQSNQGLSVARNVGLKAATGSIVAYTDDDCFVDADWLTFLVHQFQQTGAAGVGGPNLTPEDGRLAACVAACPGQPTHVLVSDQVAEHIPGCNMAFRRDALLAVNGCDPIYRKAGDDVDLCWRLQHAGYFISFAPGAFVWHHRRQGPRSYLKQQRGYGEAEALLYFKHPDKFNARGESRWHGQMYGGFSPGVRLGGPIIYHGVFATGLFQTAYQPGAAHWATVPATLEWHAIAAVVALFGIAWWPLWIVAGIMLVLSVALAALLACQAQIPAKFDSTRSRLTVMVLSYLQPLVRSWSRYRTWLGCFPIPISDTDDDRDEPRQSFPLSGRADIEYWSQEWRDRTELLNNVSARLTANHWTMVTDSGWSDWDLEVSGDRYSFVKIQTVQEDLGSGKRLIRVRFRQKPRVAWWSCVGTLALFAIAMGLATGITFALSAAAIGAIAAGYYWYRGVRRAGQLACVFDSAATALGMIRCPASKTRVES